MEIVVRAVLPFIAGRFLVPLLITWLGGMIPDSQIRAATRVFGCP